MEFLSNKFIWKDSGNIMQNFIFFSHKNKKNIIKISEQKKKQPDYAIKV